MIYFLFKPYITTPCQLAGLGNHVKAIATTQSLPKAASMPVPTVKSFLHSLGNLRTFLKNHMTHKDEACTVVSKDTSMLAYYIAGGVHAEKIRKSTVPSLMKQPTQFLQGS